ncbi:MAG: LD-carboxypeptidase [Bacteroidales bacterium]|jgi:muramoyltetrapeptide carboxypeptidase|nr:LD-carboxypeptidase [Bacteroidales bacterium]MBP5419042.1 LD-carboxypeptidase [Bacteroidales bacterium]
MKITIIEPSSLASTDVIKNAVRNMEHAGHKVTVMPHVYGNPNAGEEQPLASLYNDYRYNQIRAALDDDSDAIFCARGGYGAIRMIQEVGVSAFTQCDKWIVGFSDITVIHSAMISGDRESVHGPMLKRIAEFGIDDPDVNGVFNIITGKEIPSVIGDAHGGSIPGRAQGKLIGGNLATLISLRGTPIDMDPKGAILLLEDIGEYVYNIDRMMQNLIFSGVMKQINGLVVGQMTDMKEGKTQFGQTAEMVVAQAARQYDIPVWVGCPIGHDRYRNAPVVMGHEYELDVNDSTARLMPV